MSRAALILLLPLLLAGCTDDYLNHEDRVSYDAGNAVRANLIAETVNPERRDMYSTGGLGQNGNVVSGYGGNCEYADQHASNGSLCGGRSAQSRPNGFTPPPENPP